MAVLGPKNLQKGLSITKRLGKPNSLGEMWCGWSELGDDDPYAGVYQTRPRKRGQIVVKMRHAWPDCGHTVRQEEMRSIFADGVSAWHGLTPLEKQSYNQRKYPLGMSGFARHMKEYLNANK